MVGLEGDVEGLFDNSNDRFNGILYNAAGTPIAVATSVTPASPTRARCSRALTARSTE